MRLICGFVRLDGARADQPLLDDMVAAMSVARRRAGRADFRDGAAALAVLDFSVDTSRPLPVLGNAHLAADVRLDEPDELAARLNLTTADQDRVLLEAATKPGMLRHVLGDFAFALWDAQAETLICGRDNFGIRPFVYAHKAGELFAFASLPAALYGSGIVPKRVNREAAIRRSINDFRFDDGTVEGVKRLPPAHILTVSRAGISIERYWQLDRSAIGTAHIGPDQAAAELRRRVEQAVLSRIPAGVEVGSHLSGGLDSSAIAILAARKLRDDGRVLHAYSFLDRLRNDIQLEDESEFVNACLDQESGIDWQAIRPPAGMAGRDAPLDIDLMLPLTDDFPETQVVRAADAKGVELILSGWGGDEAATFNGRGTMTELLRRGKLRTLAREIGAVARRQTIRKRNLILSELLYPFVPERPLQLARRAFGKKAMPGNLTSAFLAPKMLRALGDRGKPLVVADGRETRWRLITSAHIAHRAEAWAQIGARSGLAFAFPLLDRRVVEFALSLPSEFFLRDGVSRRVFRDAMQGILPERVRTRTHKFPPFPGWLVDIADSREAVHARLHNHETNPDIASVLDFDVLEGFATQCPSGDEARVDALGGETDIDAGKVVALIHALNLANYLTQHDNAPGNDERIL